MLHPGRVKRAMLLHRMKTGGHPKQIPTRRRGVWRRPPITIPPGRRPSLRRSPKAYLRSAALGLGMASGYGAASVRGFIEVGWPVMAMLTGVLAAGPFVYGIALLATSRHGTRRVPSPMGDRITVGTRVWLGLGLVLPGVLGSIGAVFVLPSADSHGWFAFFAFAPCLVAVGCVLIAYVLSIRPIKATIVAGLAPSFVTSPDHLWWWDGTAWFGVPSVAPLHALRSVDDNYWWTGDRWCPMPALPPPRPRGSPWASMA